jgi:hypothetical protein
MSKLMLILGIAVAAAAVAVGLLVFFSPGQMQVLGVAPETAAILLVGGLGLIGVGAIIAALDRGTEATVELRRWLAGRDAGATRISAIGPSLAAASSAPEASPAPAPASEPAVRESVIAVSAAATAETIAALDKAKEEMAAAIGEAPAEPEKGEVEEEEVGEVEGEELELADGGHLYVVEERLIRGRPARVLSDGTVEAETDEGWMRFENREHLEEYLDAMSPDRG